MELSDIFGLPAHPLVVHAVVVLVPLAAVGGIAVSIWPRLRAQIGWYVAAVAVLSVVLVPLATGSGESLEERVRETDLVETHADMGEQLLPWVVVLAVGTVAVMFVARAAARARGGSVPRWAVGWVPVVLAVVTVVAAGGALVQVARIGHSGAKATWNDVGPAAEGEHGGDD